MTSRSVIEATRPRLAILSYSNGRFDARTRRVAQSAGAAGFDVVAYARWEPGLPLEETIDGFRVHRLARFALALKVALDGSISTTSENLLIYAKLYGVPRARRTRLIEGKP